MRTHPALRLTLLIVSSTVACSELGGADLARSGSPAEATPATTGGEAAPGSPALPPGAPGSNASGAAGVGASGTRA